MSKILIHDKNEEDKDLYGYYIQEDDMIGVNVEKVWKDTKTIKKFIRLFVETWVHENIHKLIWHERRKNKNYYKIKRKQFSDVGEEYVVRKINNEIRVGFDKFKNQRIIKKNYSSKSQQM